jgi:hypothetical protein
MKISKSEKQQFRSLIKVLRPEDSKAGVTARIYVRISIKIQLMLKSKKDSSIAENHYTTQDKTKRTTQILNTKSKSQRLCYQ